MSGGASSVSSADLGASTATAEGVSAGGGGGPPGPVRVPSADLSSSMAPEAELMALAAEARRDLAGVLDRRHDLHRRLRNRFFYEPPLPELGGMTGPGDSLLEGGESTAGPGTHRRSIGGRSMGDHSAMGAASGRSGSIAGSAVLSGRSGYSAQSVNSRHRRRGRAPVDPHAHFSGPVRRALRTAVDRIPQSRASDLAGVGEFEMPAGIPLLSLQPLPLPPPSRAESPAPGAKSVSVRHSVAPELSPRPSPRAPSPAVHPFAPPSYGITALAPVREGRLARAVASYNRHQRLVEKVVGDIHTDLDDASFLYEQAKRIRDARKKQLTDAHPFAVDRRTLYAPALTDYRCGAERQLRAITEARARVRDASARERSQSLMRSQAAGSDSDEDAAGAAMGPSRSVRPLFAHMPAVPPAESAESRASALRIARLLRSPVNNAVRATLASRSRGLAAGARQIFPSVLAFEVVVTRQQLADNVRGLAGAALEPDQVDDVVEALSWGTEDRRLEAVLRRAQMDAISSGLSTPRLAGLSPPTSGRFPVADSAAPSRAASQADSGRGTRSAAQPLDTPATPLSAEVRRGSPESSDGAVVLVEGKVLSAEVPEGATLAAEAAALGASPTAAEQLLVRDVQQRVCRWCDRLTGVAREFYMSLMPEKLRRSAVVLAGDVPPPVTRTRLRGAIDERRGLVAGRRTSAVGVTVTDEAAVPREVRLAIAAAAQLYLEKYHDPVCAFTRGGNVPPPELRTVDCDALRPAWPPVVGGLDPVEAFPAPVMMVNAAPAVDRTSACAVVGTGDAPIVVDTGAVQYVGAGQLVSTEAAAVIDSIGSASATPSRVALLISPPRATAAIHHRRSQSPLGSPRGSVAPQSPVVSKLAQQILHSRREAQIERNQKTATAKTQKGGKLRGSKRNRGPQCGIVNIAELSKLPPAGCSYFEAFLYFFLYCPEFHIDFFGFVARLMCQGGFALPPEAKDTTAVLEPGPDLEATPALDARHGA